MDSIPKGQIGEDKRSRASNITIMDQRNNIESPGHAVTQFPSATTAGSTSEANDDVDGSCTINRCQVMNDDLLFWYNLFVRSGRETTS